MPRKVGKTGWQGAPRVITKNDQPSETIVSDAHLADINNIMRTFARDGVGILDEAVLQFGDVSDFTDLADALNQARKAEVEFLKLPSKVREVFNHDVAQWLDTAHDADKRQALVEKGFLLPLETIQEGAKEGSNKPQAGGEAENAGGAAEPAE